MFDCCEKWRENTEGSVLVRDLTKYLHLHKQILIENAASRVKHNKKK